MLLKQRPVEATDGAVPDAPMSAAPAHAACHGTPSGKTCHICGSREHLKAQCPSAQEIRRVEMWIETLQGEHCLLPTELKESSLREANERLTGLKAEAAASKERAVLPEHLISTRRAEVKKHSEALSTARLQLEQHEKLVEDVRVEGERLHGVVQEEAEAFRAAETALEAALEAALAKPQATEAPAPASTPAIPSPALSAQGAEALNTLAAQLAGLASPANISNAEADYQTVVAEANDTGRDPPTLLAFVLERLSKAGTQQLELVRFDLAKDCVANLLQRRRRLPPRLRLLCRRQCAPQRMPCRRENRGRREDWATIPGFRSGRC